MSVTRPGAIDIVTLTTSSSSSKLPLNNVVPPFRGEVVLVVKIQKKAVKLG